MIREALFVKSSVTLKQCPQDHIPEYAFIGRSNCGKSSLINRLTNQKYLTKVSSTPGKTQLINHFLINKSYYLVDLPGYGWAKTSKKTRDNMIKLVDNYLMRRETLTCIFLLIDSRHINLPIDHQVIEKMGDYEIPFSLVMTKTDKIGQKELQKNIGSLQKQLSHSWEELPHIFSCSSFKNIGIEELLIYIEKINSHIKNK